MSTRAATRASTRASTRAATGRGGAPAWSPLRLSGLLHWYDFSDASQVAASAGRVVTIQAKGTANVATAFGTAPTWTPGDGYCTASGAGALILSSALTTYPLIMVASMRTGPADATSTVMSTGYTTTSNNWIRLVTFDASGVNANPRTGASTEVNQPDGQGAIATTTNVVGAAEFASTTSRRARRNAGAWGAANTGTYAPSLDRTYLLGLRSGGADVFSDSGIRLYDALFLTSVTEEEWAQLYSYLSAKHV